MRGHPRCKGSVKLAPVRHPHYFQDLFMKKLAVLLAAAFAPVAFINVAHADLALATAKGCTACHQVDKKLIGPAYNAVAACYANKDAKKLAETKTKLVKHVKEGGAGVWGQIPMAAHPQVSNEEIVKIVDWIMTQKPGECPKEFKPK
jgi:cytochrome c